MSEPIDPELAELVRAEKAHAPDPPDAVRERVFSALAARIGAPGPGGGAGGSGGSPLARFAAAHPFAGPIVALVVGAAAGAAATRGSAPEPETRVVYVDRVVPGPTVTEMAPAAPPPPAVASSAPSPSAAPAIDARGLAAERMLLDGARAALARGEPQAALDAVDRHARAYPQGVLAEEREALAVKALAAAGRFAEARARGEKFRAQFPRSVSLAAVNATLATLPE